MTLIKWNNSYSVNKKSIDDQHKKLFNILNRLEHSILKNEDHKNMNKLVNDLEEYTMYHFSEEETMLEKINYPELEIHKRIHKQFVNKVKKFKKDLENNILLSIEVLQFLSDWLLEHIRITDKKYADFFKNDNIK